MNNDISNISSFVELYLAGCKINNEPGEWLLMYQDLDNLWMFIKNSKYHDNYIAALSHKRQCIVIPYVLFNDHRLPPDDIIDGQEVIFASPGHDIYRADLLNQMQNNIGEHIFGNIRHLRKWKLLIDCSRTSF